jgi:inosine/xanthosine triphosphate pyrophosphatase family protein
MILLTSNKHKIAEYRSFGLDIEVSKGPDLKEVQGTPDEVIVYKSLAAGKGTVVEDAILIIDGVEIVDIRWKVKELTNTTNALWVVSLGYNDGETIHVYRGKISGSIRADVELPEDAFGFEPLFVPEGSDKTLLELDRIGKKSEFSARRIATDNLLEDKKEFVTYIDQIPQWKGKYQNN